MKWIGREGVSGVEKSGRDGVCGGREWQAAFIEPREGDESGRDEYALQHRAEFGAEYVLFHVLKLCPDTFAFGTGIRR